jgi:alkyldihydroxyacetonephosphate synthase
MRPRSWWGWGWADEALPRETQQKLGAAIGERFGWADVEVRSPAALDDLELPVPRIAAPSSLRAIAADDVESRAGHTYGKSYRDVVRGFRGELPHPPDLVVRPRDESDVVAVLDWCAGAGIAAVPYGGGSSVCGGVEGGLIDGGGAPWVSVDLTALDQGGRER